VAVSRTLRRLLRIRELQEEQSRSALETALGELSQLETALTATEQRDRSGRKLVGSGAQSGNLTDRVAGIEEMRAAAGVASALSVRLAAAERRVAALRDSFVSSRMQRQQARTLVEDGEARIAAAEARRDQQELDDLHRVRSKNGDENR
jgi:flagellar biosynthesis chaperone FliJ